MSKSLTEKTKKEIKKIFEFVDSDKDGKIEIDDVIKTLDTFDLLFRLLNKGDDFDLNITYSFEEVCKLFEENRTSG